MKNILNYKQFRLNEDLSPEQIKTQTNNEKIFMRKMEELSKDILTENEQDIDHDTNEKLTEILFRIYDKFFYEKANKEGLNDADYQKALGLVKIDLDKFRASAAGKKAEEKYVKQLAKQNRGVTSSEGEDTGEELDEVPDEGNGGEELPIPPMPIS